MTIEPQHGGTDAGRPVPVAAVEAAVDEHSFATVIDDRGREAPFEADAEPTVGEAQAAYRAMVLTRRVDLELVRLQRQGQIGVYPSSLGQEGAQVGAAMAIGPRDWVFPQYRELGIALAMGVDPAELAHLWRGTWLSAREPRDTRYALTQITIGTHALHAVGFAMGARLDHEPLAVLACFGDGATSTGDVHEAMNFAAVFDAPCVFFVQNNQYAISVPLSGQTAAPTLAHKAVGYGMPAYRCDGNDVLVTAAVVRRAVDLARSTHRPSVVEAVTYRREAHTTSDDPTRYRTDDEVEAATATDPIDRLRAWLGRRGRWDEALARSWADEADAVAARLRADVVDAPHGDPMELFEHVHVDPTGHFGHQRDLLRATLARDDVGRRAR